MKNLFDLTGKVSIVTGGNGGIGKAIALGLAEYGSDIVIAARNEKKTEDVVKQILAKGRRCVGIQCDVLQRSDITKTIEAAVNELGGLHILVNNAGIVDSGPIESFAEATWDRIFAVNVKGIFLMSKTALPALKASTNAAIVSTASIAGKRGSANLAAYCASKFAAVGLTQSMAQEFAPLGIRVNAICPGVVGTAMWLDHLMANQSAAAFDDRMADMMPLGRPQTADDMGQAAVYLATAPNVTGVSLNVAGGFEMH